MEISIFIFISVMALALGYAAANTQNFNFWKLLFFVLFLLPVILIFGMSKYHAIVVLISFLFGFILPYAYSLKFIGNSFSNFVNAVRYRDDYRNIKLTKEELRQQAEELEQLRRAFEAARQAYYRAEQQFKDRAKEQQSSNSSESKSKERSNTNNKSQEQKSKSRSYSKNTSSTSGNSREYYLKLLGLDPNKEPTLADIRKAYKRMQMKYHPDRHPHATQEERKEFDKKLIEFKRAFEWLERN
jgi:flagellar biosynthesis GTPase FlhF